MESVCPDLASTPGLETIRRYFRYFNDRLVVDDLAQLEQSLNAARVAQIPSRVKQRRWDLAIDFHDRPDSGKTSQAEGVWARGKAKNGAPRFFWVARALLESYTIVSSMSVSLHIGRERKNIRP